MKPLGANKVFLVISAGTELLLFLLSIMPNCYELISENPFTDAETGGSEKFFFVLFNIGALFYSYAVLTAMIQKYSEIYLKELRQFRLRRIVLFVVGYLSFLNVLINAQSLTGLVPEDMPVHPESGGAIELFLL